MADAFGVHLQGTTDEYEVELKVYRQSDLLVIFAQVVNAHFPVMVYLKKFLAFLTSVQVQKGDALQNDLS